jgi:glycine cleavage system regulatory protein
MFLSTMMNQPGELDDVSERRVNRRLDRMTAILEDNRMRVQLGGKDRVGILLYLTRLVYEYDLDICVGNVNRLQDESVSSFLVTGPTEQLCLLAERLENERDQTLEGEVITPFKVFDLTINVPNRNGLILNLCVLLRDYKVNIKSLTGWLYKDLDDREWACIKTRVEVTREMTEQMPQLQRDLDTKLRSEFGLGGTEEPDDFDMDDWRVVLKERRLDLGPTNRTQPSVWFDNPLE